MSTVLNSTVVPASPEEASSEPVVELGQMPDSVIYSKYLKHAYDSN